MRLLNVYLVSYYVLLFCYLGKGIQLLREATKTIRERIRLKLFPICLNFQNEAKKDVIKIQKKGNWQSEKWKNYMQFKNKIKSLWDYVSFVSFCLLLLATRIAANFIWNLSPLMPLYAISFTWAQWKCVDLLIGAYFVPFSTYASYRM